MSVVSAATFSMAFDSSSYCNEEKASKFCLSGKVALSNSGKVACQTVMNGGYEKYSASINFGVYEDDAFINDYIGTSFFTMTSTDCSYLYFDTANDHNCDYAYELKDFIGGTEGNNLEIFARAEDSEVVTSDSPDVTVYVYDAGSCKCLSGNCCNTASRPYLFKTANSQPIGISDKFLCDASGVLFRDYYCNGASSSEKSSDSRRDTCTTCEYCSDGNSACSAYSSSKTCGTRDCSSLNTACRTYSTVDKYCDGSGDCGSGTCNSYSNKAKHTSCGSGSECDGSGNCVGCTSHNSFSCSSGDLYWYDKCDNKQEIKQDCGEDSCGSWSEYCKGDEIWHKRNCYDRGCTSNACYSHLSAEDQKVQTCDLGCIDYGTGKIGCKEICYSDSDCGSGERSDARCESDGNVWMTYHVAKCNSPGETSSSCEYYYEDRIVAYCLNGCTGDECNVCTNECSSGEKRCSGNNLQTCGHYDADTCTEWGGDQMCTLGCSNGQCNNEGCTNECSLGEKKYERYIGSDDVNLNFGSPIDLIAQTFTVGNTGANEKFSISKIMLKVYKTNNPGLITVSIKATDSSGAPTGADLFSNSTVNTKSWGSDPGGYFNVTFGNTLAGNTLEPSTTYALVLRGAVDYPNWASVRVDDTAPSYSGGTIFISENSGSTWTANSGQDLLFEIYSGGSEPERCNGNNKQICGNYDADSCLEWGGDQLCENGCTNGQCNSNIACYKNSDCGTDYWLNQPVCMNGNVADIWHSFTCNNPGTAQSSCSSTNTGKNKQLCGTNGCDTWNSVTYCKPDGNVYHNRWCYDRSCSNGACIENKRGEEQLVQTCTNGCTSGQCNIPCTNECTSGQKRCSGNSAQTCGNYDADSCTEWNSGDSCQYGCADNSCKPAPVTTCTDSDNGFNKLVKGSTVGVNGAFTDKCYEYADYLVWEYYCAGTIALPALIGCAADETCSDGACVKNICSDSDNGMNTKLKGTTTDKAGTVSDLCYQYSDSLVWENYCYEPLKKSFQVLLACAADESCKDGACVKNICSDTDGGMLKNLKGTTTDNSGSYTDSCYQYADTLMWENYCYAPLGKRFQVLLACDYPKKCVNGACQ